MHPEPAVHGPYLSAEPDGAREDHVQMWEDQLVLQVPGRIGPLPTTAFWCLLLANSKEVSEQVQ
jgi:hypothetical protein